MLVDDRHLTNYGRAELSRGDRIPQLDQLTTEENRQHYVQVCTQQVLSRIINLQSFSKADMLIILDGASPPVKKQENKRRAHRKRQAEAARDADVDMDTADPDKALERRLRAARQAGAGFCHGFIVAELMQQLREHDIAFIVSPYEADGQLAYLSQCGMVDLVMTEDSNLLCHEIETVAFKYDLEGGGVLVQRHDLGAAELQSKSLSLQDFSTAMPSCLSALDVTIATLSWALVP
jgi:exonuclease-1